MSAQADPRAPLPPSFFARPCEQVAVDLLGRWLILDPVVVRITETEAYLGPTDSAAHTSRGRTPRNAAMWGPLGRAYVYRCYGIHWMLNVVCGALGGGTAALIRAGVVVEGEPTVRERRGGRLDLLGPGKLTQGLGIDGGFNHHELGAPGGLVLGEGEPSGPPRFGRRVGIDYAAPADREALLRFGAPDQPVSHPAGLAAI